MTEKNKRRIGVFGGSFHPPHLGHTQAAALFLEKAELDLLLIVPAFLPPHKYLVSGADATQRLAMTRIAFGHLSERVEICTLEMDAKKPCFTVDTLTELQKQYPDADFFLYVGSDMFLSLETWHDYPRLFGLCTLSVLAREDDSDALRAHARYLKEAYGAQILLMGECTPISSTEIRTDLALGIRPYKLADGVYDYIVKNGLYLTGENKA